MLDGTLMPNRAGLLLISVITAFSLSLLFTSSSQVFLYFNF